jgi:DNA invertase Pin-like site-specific DNA recombinase
MKVAGKIRCSTNKQDLESQRFTLLEWAKKNEHEMTLFEEFATSGRKGIEARESMQKMLKRCEAGEFDAIVVVEISRLGRTIKMIYEIVDRLTKAGTTIILANSNTILDYNTLEGRALIGGLALAADIEWMLISERNKRGREKIKREKIKVGRKRAEEGSVSLEAVLSLKDKGMGFRGIAKELNTSIATISRMLKRSSNAQLRNVPISNCEGNNTGLNEGGVS